MVLLVAVLSGIDLFAGSILTARAEETNITNSIRVHSSTGGNRVSNGGTVRNGTSKSSVFIETTVNGKQVEHINETIESSSESTSINVQSSYQNGEQTSTIKTSPPSNLQRPASEASVSNDEAFASSTDNPHTPIISTNHETGTTTATTVARASEPNSLLQKITHFVTNAVVYVFTLFTHHTEEPHEPSIFSTLDCRNSICGHTYSAITRSGNRIS